MPTCRTCSTEMSYVVSSRKSDQIFHFFQCPKCGTPAHSITYYYSPADCPRHVTEHLGMEFKDSYHVHQLNQINRCIRCGAIQKVPQDIRNAGLSGHVEVEDPRIQKKLLWNKSAYDRLIPKDEQDGGIPPWVPDEAHIPTERELEG